MAHITDNRVSGIVMSMRVNFRALELRKRLLTDFFVSFLKIFWYFSSCHYYYLGTRLHGLTNMVFWATFRTKRLTGDHH